jgi:hypothetical protein
MPGDRIQGIFQDIRANRFDNRICLLHRCAEVAVTLRSIDNVLSQTWLCQDACPHGHVQQ